MLHDRVLAFGPQKTTAKSPWGCRTDAAEFPWFSSTFSQTVDAVFCTVRVMLCFASIPKSLGRSKEGLVEKLQWLWLDLIVPITDFRVSLQIQHLCWPSRNSRLSGTKLQIQSKHCCKSSLYCRYFSGTTQQNRSLDTLGRRARSLQRLPVSMQNTPNNQSRPRSGCSSPPTRFKQLQIWDSSLQQVTNSQSNETGRWAMGLGSPPQHCSSQFLPLSSHSRILSWWAGVKSGLYAGHLCLSFDIFSPEHQ